MVVSFAAPSVNTFLVHISHSTSFICSRKRMTTRANRRQVRETLLTASASRRPFNILCCSTPTQLQPPPSPPLPSQRSVGDWPPVLFLQSSCSKRIDVVFAACSDFDTFTVCLAVRRIWRMKGVEILMVFHKFRRRNYTRPRGIPVGERRYSALRVFYLMRIDGSFLCLVSSRIARRRRRRRR